MLLAIYLLAASVAVCYPLTKRLADSFLCRFAAAFLLGQFLLGHGSYWIAAAAPKSFHNALPIAARLEAVLLLVPIALAARTWKRRSFPAKKALADISLIALYALAAHFIFAPQLVEKGGDLFRSDVFWDFPMTMSKVNSFSFGDNFPAENPVYAHLSFSYHFFPDLVIALYQSCGLSLARALHLFSVGMLAVTLAAFSGLSREFLGSRYPGILAAMLALTSSSLHFIQIIQSRWQGSFRALLQDLYFLSPHPYVFSATLKPYNYNGNFFNLFYLIEERHLIFTCLLVLMGFLYLARHREVSTAGAALAGVLLGLSIRWGYGSSVSLLFAAAVVALYYRSENMFVTLAAAAPFFISYLLLSNSLLHSTLVTPAAREVPKMNFGFSGPLFMYWVYAYGCKIVLFPAGIVLLWRSGHRKAAAAALAVVIPALTLTNTVQLFPLSVHDNHKLLRPMNFLLDFVCAVPLFRLYAKGIAGRTGATALLLLGTLSGIIETIPFLRNPADVPVITGAAEAVAAIRSGSDPRAVFLTDDPVLLMYAGRRLYYLNSASVQGNRIFYDYFLDKKRSRAKAASIYASPSTRRFCDYLKEEKIDFVEIGSHFDLTIRLEGLQTLRVTHGGAVREFIDREKTCAASA